MRKFLVTGGAGFIGSNITEFLISKGHFVRVLDDFSSGSKAKLAFLKNAPKNRFDIIKGDVRSFPTCLRACRGMDFVLHQAARKTVSKSLQHPHIFNDVNINGTLNMLQASTEHKIKRFVFASSSSVYGDSVFFPQKESHIPAPISPYAITKLAGEHYCAVFTKLYGLKTICLRYFNVFGPRQDFNDMYAAVIVKFIHLLREGKDLTVYGDGGQSRDFTFVENIVRANYLAATAPGKMEHQVFNIATGENNSILNVIKILQQVSGKKAVIKFLPKRPGDIYKSKPDLTKIRTQLNYVPSVTFERGLKRTFDYFGGV